MASPASRTEDIAVYTDTDYDEYSPRTLPADSDRKSSKPSSTPLSRRRFLNKDFIRDISPMPSEQTIAPRRSVSFHASATSPSRNRSSVIDRLKAPQRDGADATESEADEHTSILSKPRGGKRTYNTTAGSRKNSKNGRSSSLKGGQSDGGNDAPNTDHTDEEPEEDEGKTWRRWWNGMVEKYGTVELDNRASVARDHLALERTFLAWLRTSLSFASIGIAVTQLFRLNTSLANSPSSPPTDAQLRLRHIGKPLGATFLGIGIVTLLIGFHRYFESQHYVIRGKFPASRGSVILVAFMTAALIIASFVVILSIAPSALIGSSKLKT